MAQTIKLRRSSTGGAIPSTSSLSLGEVAINTYDGKLFMKKNDGSETIIDITASAGAAYKTGSDDLTTTSVSYTPIRAHETPECLVCRLVL